MCSVDDRLGSRRARPPDVLHEGIWSRLDQADVPVVGPADQIGRAPILPSDLEDLGVALVLPYAATHDHELVPNLGLHRSPFPNLAIAGVSAQPDDQDVHPSLVENPADDDSESQALQRSTSSGGAIGSGSDAGLLTDEISKASVGATSVLGRR